MGKDYKRNEGLKHARLRCGWTQERAAMEAGVSLKTWQAWEQGTRAPTGRHLDRLALVLGCSRTELMSQPEEQDGLLWDGMLLE